MLAANPARANRVDPDPEAAPPPAAPACPGRCNAAYRAAEDRYLKQGIDHELEPWRGEPVWCPACTTSLRGDLTDWPELSPDLAEQVASGVRAHVGEYVSGSKNIPVHQQEAPWLLLDEAARFLTDWAQVIAHDRNLAQRPYTPGNDPHLAIEETCAFLRIHLHWHLTVRPAAEHWAVEDFGLELARLTRRARILTGSLELEPERVIGVPCPVCDTKALEHELEDRASARARVRRYVYNETDAGQVEVLRRPATAEESSTLRLRPPKGWTVPERFEPTVPERHTETTSAYMLGAATGYIRCRRCRPIFRLTPDEYTRWTKLLDADARARGLTPHAKLAHILRTSHPQVPTTGNMGGRA